MRSSAESEIYPRKEFTNMAQMKPRTLSGFMELLPAPQQQMERIMKILRET